MIAWKSGMNSLRKISRERKSKWIMYTKGQKEDRTKMSYVDIDSSPILFLFAII